MPGYPVSAALTIEVFVEPILAEWLGRPLREASIAEAELTRLSKSYGVYAAMESSDSKGAYNVMHSTVIFAFDADGRVRLLISDLTDGDAVIADLRQLIDL